MTKEDWRPSASSEILKLRAQLLAQIRVFFARRSILEVETPILSRAGACDPNLHSLTTTLTLSKAVNTNLLYLHTSPEFAMKRLLAAGSGSIYQIARVFRDGEQGRLHAPEFTLVEWYHVGFDHQQLIAEVGDLLRLLLGSPAYEQLTYAEAFELHAGFDPHRASLEELNQQARQLGLASSQLAQEARQEGTSPPSPQQGEDEGRDRSEARGEGRGEDPSLRSEDKDYYLNLILSHRVAPQLGWRQPTFIYDFPATQAAMARVKPGDPPVAERFELFIHGMEIANGFHELSDPVEQRARFELELERRRQLGLPAIPLDERLLAALEHGLPDCAGVALGFDRIVMILAGVEDIAQVLPFSIDRA